MFASHPSDGPTGRGWTRCMTPGAGWAGSDVRRSSRGPFREGVGAKAESCTSRISSAGMRDNDNREPAGYNRSGLRIQAIRICNADDRILERCERSIDNRDNSCAGGVIVEQSRLPVANLNHSYLQCASDSIELAEPCTSASAIASPTTNSSKPPPNSLPSRRLTALRPSRSRSRIDSERDLDADRAGNSPWISSSVRRRSRVRWCCPGAYRSPLIPAVPGRSAGIAILTYGLPGR